MTIGLVDVDSHNWPNLALMKLAAWHKAHGDTVEWWWGFGSYDRVYMSKVFDETYSQDVPEPMNTAEIVKGGTGYVRREKDGSLWFYQDHAWKPAPTGLDATGWTVKYQEFLPPEIEHFCPDYSLYPQMTENTAYGFLTRGCPRACDFCIVAAKEGRHTVKVADLPEWWNGQRRIKLMDPNTLACPQHMDVLHQLEESAAWVDFTQGLDARLLTPQNIEAINRIKKESVHFAWDRMEATNEVLAGLELYASLGKRDRHGRIGTVYCLTNFDTTMEENLFRIYTLRDLGFDPYVMIYDKPNAPREIRLLQRWCNNKLIFKSAPDFKDYDPRKG